MSTEPMLEAALDLARRNFPVFPVGAGPDGKAPLTPHGAKDATVDAAQIRDWWGRWPDAGIAIATGGGLLVLDLDGKEAAEYFGELERANGALPETLAATTGRTDGAHLYLSSGKRTARNSVGKLGPKIDTRGEGGYVIAPPSLHMASGRRYAWFDATALVAEAPGWLLDLLEQRSEKPKRKRSVVAEITSAPADAYVAAAVRGERELVRSATVGARNNQLNKSAFALGQLVGAGRLDRGHAESGLLDAAAECGLEDAEAERTIASGLDAGIQRPRSPEETRFRLTDLGNGERFAAQHRDRAVYVKAWDTWVLWDDIVHRRDETDAAQGLAKKTVRSILEEAARCTDDRARALLRKWAGQSESRVAVGAMLSFARAELAATPDVFDQKTDILVCSNGVVDLRTGELGPHRREDFCTKLTPISFDPRAARGRWEQFLGEVFCADEELIAWIKRAVGYSLTGLTREQCFFVLFGGGRNGKGRFIRQVLALAGNAGRTTAFSTFTIDSAKEKGNTPALAALRGARVVVAGEPDEGVRLSESVIKQLTGDDEIEACAKYEHPFVYTPQFKIWLHTNHRPEIRGTDEGIWRRPRMVPFAATFDGRNGNPAPDLRLDEQLDAERAGILAWAVEGAIEWYRMGLGTCAAVDGATQEYRTESDALSPFLEECVQLGETQDFVPHAALYAAYQAWCVRNGVEPWRGQTLTKRLRARGYRPDKRGDVRGFLGMRLRQNARGSINGMGSLP